MEELCCWVVIGGGCVCVLIFEQCDELGMGIDVVCTGMF